MEDISLPFETYLNSLPSHERITFLERFEELPDWAFMRFQEIFNKKHRAIKEADDVLAKEVIADEKQYAKDIIAELKRKSTEKHE